MKSSNHRTTSDNAPLNSPTPPLLHSFTPSPTIVELFRDHAEQAPDTTAVHDGGQDWTYGELAAQAEAVCGWLLQAGLTTGDRVALLLPNSVDYISCYLGILQAGGVVVALNPENTAAQLAYMLADAAPLVVITGPKAAPALAEAGLQTLGIQWLVHDEQPAKSVFPATLEQTTLQHLYLHWETESSQQPGLNDLAQIIYTSGTTGRPKGVTLSHKNLAANCRSILQYLQLTAHDSILVALPFFYSYGNSLLFTHLAAGARLVLASDFVFWNRVLDVLQQHQITGFSGVPSSYAMLLHKSDFRKRTFPDLRYMTCAGGALAPAVVEDLRMLVPHVQLFLMYGQTEATARLSTLLPEELDMKPNSIGRGIPGVELRVLDDDRRPVPPGQVGEIIARGDNLMVGYWNDSQASSEVLQPEGLRTGDLAKVDDDGYIYIVGRKSDIIKTGAYRINPKEIEEVILQLSGVAEVAVVGLPDRIWGERPVAFIVPSTTLEAPSEELVLTHCRGTLPRYMALGEVRFVDQLPKTASGKVKRVELSGGVEA